MKNYKEISITVELTIKEINKQIKSFKDSDKYLKYKKLLNISSKHGFKHHKNKMKKIYNKLILLQDKLINKTCAKNNICEKHIRRVMGI